MYYSCPERFSVANSSMQFFMVASSYGNKYDPLIMYDSKRDVANLLHEEAEERSIRERLRQKQQQKTKQKQDKKKSRDSRER